MVSLAPEHKQAQQAILPGIQFSLSVCVLFDSWFARSFSRPAGSLTRSFIPSFACFFCVRVLRDLVRRLCSFGPFGCFVHIYAFFWGGGEEFGRRRYGSCQDCHGTNCNLAFSLSPASSLLLFSPLSVACKERDKRARMIAVVWPCLLPFFRSPRF